MSTAPYFEQMDLGDYIGAPLFPDTLFLTKSAKTLKICDDENAWLSVIQPNIGFPINGFEVQLFDENGVLLSEGVGATNAPPFSLMQTMNTSVTCLAAQTYFTGAPNFADPLLSYYTISFGFLIVVAGPIYIYIDQTELFTYELADNCCDRSCLLYTSPSPRDGLLSRMPSSA